MTDQTGSDRPIIARLERLTALERAALPPQINREAQTAACHKRARHIRALVEKENAHGLE